MASKNHNTSRIGFGYDSHRFLTDEEMLSVRGDTGTDIVDPNKPLILGGVKVGGHRPFKARSDGDVVFHAAVNAILSALSLDEARDIGTLFPNTDRGNSNRPSSDFLIGARDLAKRHGFLINDLKLTIKGKVLVDLSAVRKNLADILRIDPSCILAQGTSGEEMDAAGKGLGIEVFGICVLGKM